MSDGAGAGAGAGAVERDTTSSREKRSTKGTGASTAAVVMEALKKNDMMDDGQLEDFTRLYELFVEQFVRKRPVLDFSRLSPLPSSRLAAFDKLEVCPDDAMLHHELLQKVAVVKLNGGMGSTMGCRGPKSAIGVRGGLTFLDLTVRQIEFLNTKYGVDVPLVLMNSFKTNEETIKIVRKYSMHNLTMHCFNQSCYPCVDATHYSPIPTKPFSHDTRHQWYPPGHGDVYRALVESGVLTTMMRAGKEYLFISNVDNLGATVDLNIIYHILNNDVEVCMEVTDRTRADVQGGILAEYGGKVKLVEAQQVPARHISDFNSVKKHNVFNTNNLWVSCKTIQRLMATRSLRAPLVVSPRVVHGKRYLQLETVAGSIMEFCATPLALKVPRSRFLPVKSTSDLLRVQSNLYKVKHGSLTHNPLRDVESTPIIKLGEEFTHLADYQDRIVNVPDILELDHLTVSGDVHFGSNVVLRGTVIIVASEGSRIDIPDGSVLEDKVVTGNLRILEH